MRYKYLDHTADAMFEAYGRTLAEMFAHAGLAMFNILTDIDKVKQQKSFTFTIKADSLEKLMFDFLDELLFYLDTEHMLFSSYDITISHNGDYKLKCIASGDVASAYETHGDVKAPTYNEMEIVQKEGTYRARVVVDI